MIKVFCLLLYLPGVEVFEAVGSDEAIWYNIQECAAEGETVDRAVSLVISPL